MSKLLTLLRRAAYTLVGLLLVVFLLVQFQQRLLRHRAERLHAEILALQLHPGTFADIERMQKEWGRSAHYDGECSSHHCIYEISLMDPLSWSILGRHLILPIWIVGSYLLLQAPPSMVTAKLCVRDNKMWREEFSIAVWSRSKFWDRDPTALWIGIDSGPRLFATHGSYNAPDLRRGYYIGGPGGCSFCIRRWINISPAATATDVLRLNAINFGCMTSFRTCKSIDQLDNALKENEGTSQSNAEYLSGRDDCSLPLARLAQETDNIVLAEVTRVFTRTYPGSADSDTYWTVKIVSRLKNANGQLVGSTQDIPVFGTQVAAIGRLYFLLFHQPGNLEDPATLEPDPCGAFPDTPSNLDAILTGITKDPSVGEAYDPIAHP